MCPRALGYKAPPPHGVQVTLGSGCGPQWIPVCHHIWGETECPVLAEERYFIIKRPATFFCVFYDLTDGFLQAVGSEHELLPWTEYLRPAGARRPQRALPRGAAAAARPVSIFRLLRDGGGWGGQGG